MTHEAVSTQVFNIYLFDLLCVIRHLWGNFLVYIISYVMTHGKIYGVIWSKNASLNFADLSKRRNYGKN
jgi:hypothetical protein